MFIKTAVLRNFAIFTENVSESLFYKETPMQVFSCKYCKIFKNSLFLQNTFGGCFYKWTDSRDSYTLSAISEKQGTRSYKCMDFYEKKQVHFNKFWTIRRRCSSNFMQI